MICSESGVAVEACHVISCSEGGIAVLEARQVVS